MQQMQIYGHYEGYRLKTPVYMEEMALIRSNKNEDEWTLFEHSYDEGDLL